MSTYQTGDPIQVLRPLKLKGWQGRFVNLDQNDPAFCWVAFGANGAHFGPPELKHYTNQTRAPRKMLALSGIEPIPDPA